MKDVDFKVFSGPANQANGRVVGLCAPGGSVITRSDIDDYTQFVGIYRAKGLAWIKVNEIAKGRDGLQSPIVKNLHAPIASLTIFSLSAPKKIISPSLAPVLAKIS